MPNFHRRMSHNTHSRRRRKWIDVILSTFKNVSWKTSAKINTAVVIIFLLFLVGTLAYTTSQAQTTGQLSHSSFVLFRGRCEKAQTINVALHVVLNIFGTLILASSNFFMQILVAPSRSELDRAHQRATWMDIGAPTIRNFAGLSRFKLISWFILLASSVPIHLLFNSSVILVQSQRSQFGLTVAAEPFLDGAKYFVPGAALWNVAVPKNCTQPVGMEGAIRCASLAEDYLLGVWDNKEKPIYCSVSTSMVPNAAGMKEENIDLRSCRETPKARDFNYIWDDNTATQEEWDSIPILIDPNAVGAERINCSTPGTMERAQWCIDGVQFDEYWKQPSNRTMADYMDPSSKARKQLAKAAMAQQNGWERLSPAECRDTYLECGSGLGLRDRGDVVVVLASVFPTSDPLKMRMKQGWTRSEVFPGMLDEDKAFWDEVVPDKEVNSLFYTSECQINLNFTITDDGENMCRNTCALRLGLGGVYTPGEKEANPVLAVSTDNGQGRYGWEYVAVTRSERPAWVYQMRSGISDEFSQGIHEVAYCLAEVVSSGNEALGTAQKKETDGFKSPLAGGCQINVSNLILFVVTLCVLAKAVQCSLVTYRLTRANDRDPPLMTLGDTVDSLIRHPDPITESMCTLSLDDLWMTESTTVASLPEGEVKSWPSRGKTTARSLIPRVTTRAPAKLLQPGPRQWDSKNRRFLAVIHRSSWLLTYALFLSVLGTGIASFLAGTKFFKIPSHAFGPSSLRFIPVDSKSQKYSGSFLSYVVLANVPQLIISLCYLRFNEVLTRLFIAREWADMCVGYKPLRTTQPRGGQVSSYTLQLPLAWSIAPILLGIVLHFLVSNALFVIVSDGGFFNVDGGTNQDRSIGISADGFVGLGYSTLAIGLAVLLFCVLIVTPVVLGMRWIDKGTNVVLVGTNSLAISAACHPSSLTKAEEEDDEGDNTLQRTSRSSSVASTPNISLPVTAQTGDPRTPGVFDEQGPLISVKALAPQLTDEWLPASQHDGRGADSFAQESRSKGDCLAESDIRWGVVEMPASFYENATRASGEEDTAKNGALRHLTFGVRADDVQKPVWGNWYV